MSGHEAKDHDFGEGGFLCRRCGMVFCPSGDDGCTKGAAAASLADLIADEWHEGAAFLTEAVRAHIAAAFDAEAAKWLLPACPCGSCKAVALVLSNLRAALGIPKSSAGAPPTPPADGAAIDVASARGGGVSARPSPAPIEPTEETT